MLEESTLELSIFQVIVDWSNLSMEGTELFIVEGDLQVDPLNKEEKENFKQFYH